VPRGWLPGSPAKNSFFGAVRGRVGWGFAHPKPAPRIFGGGLAAAPAPRPSTLRRRGPLGCPWGTLGCPGVPFGIIWRASGPQVGEFRRGWVGGGRVEEGCPSNLMGVVRLNFKVTLDRLGRKSKNRMVHVFRNTWTIRFMELNGTYPSRIPEYVDHTLQRNSSNRVVHWFHMYEQRIPGAIP